MAEWKGTVSSSRIQNTNVNLHNFWKKDDIIRMFNCYLKIKKSYWNICCFAKLLSPGYGSIDLHCWLWWHILEGQGWIVLFYFVKCNNLKDCRWFIGRGYCQLTSDLRPGVSWKIPVTKHVTTILFMQESLIIYNFI